MTKRRDRNRKARYRKRVYRFYWSDAEEHAVARIVADRILTGAAERKTGHDQATQTDRGRTGI